MELVSMTCVFDPSTIMRFIMAAVCVTEEQPLYFTSSFYRAMHVVQAQYCYHKSSVRLSVTLRYAEHISWISSKLITRIN